MIPPARLEMRPLTLVMFSVSVRRVSDVGADTVVVTAEYDLDGALSGHARRQLEEVLRPVTAMVVLDVSDVFVGVAGLGLLLDVVRRRHAIGRLIGIVGVMPRLVELVNGLGLPTLPTFVSIEAAAQAAIAIPRAG